jgi:crossover junction endodeoxyribonuclease RusA
MFEFDLPYPPVNNSYYRNFRGRMVISAKGRAYAAEVARLIGKVEPISERIDLTIEAFPPDLRRRDLDGIPKALQDALTKCGFWLDDEQIDVLKIVRMPKIRNGKVRLTVQLIEK